MLLTNNPKRAFLEDMITVSENFDITMVTEGIETYGQGF